MKVIFSGAINYFCWVFVCPKNPKPKQKQKLKKIKPKINQQSHHIPYPLNSFAFMRSRWWVIQNQWRSSLVELVSWSWSLYMNCWNKPTLILNQNEWKTHGDYDDGVVLVAQQWSRTHKKTFKRHKPLLLFVFLLLIIFLLSLFISPYQILGVFFSDKEKKTYGLKKNVCWKKNDNFRVHFKSNRIKIIIKKQIKFRKRHKNTSHVSHPTRDICNMQQM